MLNKVSTITGGGSTKDAVTAFRQLVNHLGTLESVSGWWDKIGWYEVRVVGSKHTLVLHGLGWGYGGEGPHGTETVLREIGVHPYDCEAVAFQAPNKESGNIDCAGKCVWEIKLPSVCAQLNADAGMFISYVTHKVLEQQKAGLAIHNAPDTDLVFEALCKGWDYVVSVDFWFNPCKSLAQVSDSLCRKLERANSDLPAHQVHELILQ